MTTLLCYFYRNIQFSALLCIVSLLTLTTVGCANHSTSSLSPIDPVGAIENSLVFPAGKYPQGNWQPVGLQQEEVDFTSADGTKLHGWLVRHPNPRAIVLFAHGNAGNVTHRAELLRLLRDRMGVTAMTFDYRGYGRSEGTPNEQGILADARAARAELARRTDTAESNIVLMGRSLGGGVAVDLAANDGARGLILESTFTTLPDAAGEHFATLPVNLLMKNRLDSLSKIGHYYGPLLHSHGDADQVIPFTQGEELFATANTPKRFVRISGGGHNDPQNEEFYEELDEFLDALP